MTTKSRVLRIGTIVGTLAVVGTLVSMTVASSGAYFTDSKGGAISGNLGTVAVNISGENINFANLLPGETQTQTVWVQNTGTGNEDIYLAFKNTGGAWSAVNTLGQYGKFVVNGLTYDNLNNYYDSSTGVPGAALPGEFMSTNPNSGCYNVPRIPVNFLPHVIKLGTLSAGQLWSFNISFTLNPCMTGGEGAALWGSSDNFNPAIAPAPLLFDVAAFQPGVDPTDQMNGAGKITPLSLPYPGDQRTPTGAIYQ